MSALAFTTAALARQTSQEDDVRSGLKKSTFYDEPITQEDAERERIAVHRSTGTARRTGSVLRLSLLNGRWIGFRDRRACESDAKTLRETPSRSRPTCTAESEVELHIYRGLVADGLAHLVERRRYEEWDFVLLHRRSGQTTTEIDVQPWGNGRVIVALSSCLPNSEPGLILIEVTALGFDRPVHDRAVCALDANGTFAETRAEWLSRDHLRLAPVGVPNTDQRVTLDVRRIGKRWRHESSAAATN